MNSDCDGYPPPLLSAGHRRALHSSSVFRGRVEKVHQVRLGRPRLPAVWALTDSFSGLFMVQEAH